MFIQTDTESILKCEQDLLDAYLKANLQLTKLNECVLKENWKDIGKQLEALNGLFVEAAEQLLIMTSWIKLVIAEHGLKK